MSKRFFSTQLIALALSALMTAGVFGSVGAIATAEADTGVAMAQVTAPVQNA